MRKYIKATFIILVALSLCAWKCSQDVELPPGTIIAPYDTSSYEPLEIVYGYNNYTEFIVGDLSCPIIIAAPHGGHELPANISDRVTGVTDADLNTQELVRDISDAIFQQIGLRPHIVINKLHRRKMDANRAIQEAAEGNAHAQKAWTDYHNFIRAAKRIVDENVGKGLYLDIHGHGHAINRIEVGYLLDKFDLAKSDELLNADSYKSSIKAIAAESTGTFSELVRGPQSFGTLLHVQGYPSVPSLSDPEPGITNDFFEGGYSTQVHGSVTAGAISAIQLELNRPGLRDTDVNRKAFAAKLAVVIQEYFLLHYSIQL